MIRLSGFFIITSNNWIISVIENSQSTVPELRLALLVVCGGGSGDGEGSPHISEKLKSMNMTAKR